MQDSAFEVDSPSLVLYPGDGVSVVIGDKTYRGTMFVDNGRWYVKVIAAEGEVDEVVIHKL
jgi:hypothetical protein